MHLLMKEWIKNETMNTMVDGVSDIEERERFDEPVDEEREDEHEEAVVVAGQQDYDLYTVQTSLVGTAVLTSLVGTVVLEKVFRQAFWNSSDPLKEGEHLHGVKELDQGTHQHGLNLLVFIHKFIILSKFFRNNFKIIFT